MEPSAKRALKDVEEAARSSILPAFGQCMLKYDLEKLKSSGGSFLSEAAIKTLSVGSILQGITSVDKLHEAIEGGGAANASRSLCIMLLLAPTNADILGSEIFARRVKEIGVAGVRTFMADPGQSGAGVNRFSPGDTGYCTRPVEGLDVSDKDVVKKALAGCMQSPVDNDATRAFFAAAIVDPCPAKLSVKADSSAQSDPYAGQHYKFVVEECPAADFIDAVLRLENLGRNETWFPAFPPEVLKKDIDFSKTTLDNITPAVVELLVAIARRQADEEKDGLFKFSSSAVNLSVVKHESKMASGQKGAAKDSAAIHAVSPYKMSVKHSFNKKVTKQLITYFIVHTVVTRAVEHYALTCAELCQAIPTFMTSRKAHSVQLTVRRSVGTRVTLDISDISVPAAMFCDLFGMSLPDYKKFAQNLNNDSQDTANMLLAESKIIRGISVSGPAVPEGAHRSSAMMFANGASVLTKIHNAVFQYYGDVSELPNQKESDQKTVAAAQKVLEDCSGSDDQKMATLAKAVLSLRGACVEQPQRVLTAQMFAVYIGTHRSLKGQMTQKGYQPFCSTMMAHKSPGIFSWINAHNHAQINELIKWTAKMYKDLDEDGALQIMNVVLSQLSRNDQVKVAMAFAKKDEDVRKKIVAMNFVDSEFFKVGGHNASADSLSVPPVAVRAQSKSKGGMVKLYDSSNIMRSLSHTNAVANGGLLHRPTASLETLDWDVSKMFQEMIASIQDAISLAAVQAITFNMVPGCAGLPAGNGDDAARMKIVTAAAGTSDIVLVLQKLQKAAELGLASAKALEIGASLVTAKLDRPVEIVMENDKHLDIVPAGAGVTAEAMFAEMKLLSLSDDKKAFVAKTPLGKAAVELIKG